MDKGINPAFELSTGENKEKKAAVQKAAKVKAVKAVPPASPTKAVKMRGGEVFQICCHQNY